MDTLEDTLVGIDFGTTNTVISIFENNKVKILNDSIYKTIPSKIGFMNNNIYCNQRSFLKSLMIIGMQHELEFKILK